MDEIIIQVRFNSVGYLLIRMEVRPMAIIFALLPSDTYRYRQFRLYRLLLISIRVSLTSRVTYLKAVNVRAIRTINVHRTACSLVSYH